MQHFLNGIRIVFLSLLGAAAIAQTPASAPEPQTPEASAPVANPVVVMQTSLGELHIELFAQQAPISTQNFLHYVESGFYNGVIFHRVVPGFVVQGGGFDQEYQRKAGQAPIVNESANGEKNLRGTLSMARTNDPNSATSQFFINLQDNLQLDGTAEQPGYAVFGKVIEGMKVVDAMTEQPQGKHSGVFTNAPNEPIVIERAFLRKAAPQPVQQPAGEQSSEPTKPEPSPETKQSPAPEQPEAKPQPAPEPQAIQAGAEPPAQAKPAEQAP